MPLTGNYDDAMRYYNRAIELHAANADAFVARGAAQANRGLLPAAADDFRHALQLDPDSRNAAAYLAAVQQRLLKRGEGVAAVRPSPACAQPGAMVAPAGSFQAHAGGSAPTSGIRPGQNAATALVMQDLRNQPESSTGRLREEPSQSSPASSGGVFLLIYRYQLTGRSRVRTVMDGLMMATFPLAGSSSSSSSGGSLDGEDVRRALALIMQVG